MSSSNRIAVAVAAAILGSLTMAVDSHAATPGQVEPADRSPRTVRVVYVEQAMPGRWMVELNNGASYRLPGCRFEDSRNCVWDAGTRGNGRGRSFTDVGGELYRIPARLMARA